MALSFRRRPRQESDECACLACHPEQMPDVPSDDERTIQFFAAVLEGAEARAWLLDDLDESRWPSGLPGGSQRAAST